MKTKITFLLSTLALLFSAFLFAFLLPVTTLALTLDTTGGDCPTIGTWDAPTQTCTLTQNITETFVINADDVTLDGAGHTITGTATSTGITVSAHQNVVIKNLTISGFGTGMSFWGFGHSLIEGNTILTGGQTSAIGISLGGNGTSNTVVKNNIIEGGGMAGIYGGDADSDIFEGNTVKNFQIGLRFEYCAIGHTFRGNTIEGNTLGAFFAGSTGTFSRNNFKNNGRDIENQFLPFGCGRGVETFSEPLPVGGNYWSANTACFDSNHDNICDTPYLAATTTDGFGAGTISIFDNFPWASENGWNLPTSTPPILSNPTETEDDGKQDGKGVADKTNFTFSVTAEGEPDSVNLFVNGAAIAFVKTGNTYTATSTFPKGHYTWHIEAIKGTETVGTAEQHFTTGYSNVAFLPGLEASRLYRAEILSGSDEDQLWEPTRNQDVEELYLDPVTGESVSSNIYTRDVIGSAYGLMNIYSSFIEFMNGLKTDGTIHEWEELPYDWRFDYAKLLASGKKTGENISYLEATSTPFILQELRRLAEDSDTGKVTIITHSNGGLVAKYLLKKLENENDPLLPNIDKLIMVAAPQIGTPGAIEALLHGDEQQIGVAISTTDLGLLMDEEHSRELGENMQSAYNLLPSQKYFETVQSPVIEFEQNDPITHNFSTLYGKTINTPDELRNFLLGDPQSGTHRTEPAPDDEESPNVLKQQFLDRATENHDTMIDDWTPPASMEVVQIAGWGIKTLSGIHYSCGLLTCSSLSTLDRKILKTTDGDGTVVVPSALAVSTSTINVQRYFVRLDKHNTITRINRDHSDITEIKSLRDFIENIIKGNRTLTPFVFKEKPLEKDEGKRLDFRLHSPVSLHLYDTEGNHTGRIPNPIPGSDFRAYEARLPNSYYREYGETKYAGSDTFATTTIRLVGEALGSFTFDIDETLGDTIVASTTWKDIPVTASSTLTLDIQTLTSTTVLQMDVDGDGIVDTALSQGEGVTSQELLAIIKGIVKTLDLPDKKEMKLLKRIEKLEKELAKEHKNEKQEKRKTVRAFEEITKQIKKFEKKGLLTTEEAREMLEIVAKIQASMVI